MEDKKEYGKKDGSRRGRQQGGRGKNQTDECRHPKIKKDRK